MNARRQVPGASKEAAIMRRITVALAVVALAATGCGGIRANAGEPSTPPPPLSKAAAKTVLANYVAARDRADRTMNDKLLATFESNPSLQVDLADYAWARFDKNKSYDSYEFVEPTFFIPGIAGYPKWFMTKSRESPNSDRPTVMIFQRQRAGGPWHQVFTSSLHDVSGMPKPATNPDGSLQAAADTDASAAMTPKATMNAYARYLNKDGAVAAAYRIEPDLDTGKLISSRANNIARLAACCTVTESYSTAADEPAYALRTTDGGLLVFFALHRTETMTVTEGDYYIDSDQSPWNTETHAARVTKEYVYELMVKVPPKGSGNLTVIGNYWNETAKFLE